MFRPLVLAGLIAAGGALSGCATSGGPKSPDPKTAARTPTEQFPLKTEAATDQIALGIHADGLSEPQISALGDLAARWRQSGSGTPIILKVPRGAVDPVAAAQAGAIARGILLRSGASPTQVQIETYQAGTDVKAPLLVAYEGIEAVVPQCGRDWDNLTGTQANYVPANYGCAVSANMAAQIADPSDIRAPRGEDAPDAGRRVDVMGKYRKGVLTEAEESKRSSGAVSRVIP